jgi:hypothetical protein
MKPSTGLLLRLLGPLIQLLCVALLIAYPGEGVFIAWLPLRYLYYAGFAVGLMMVIAGLTLVKRVQPAQRPTIKE